MCTFEYIEDARGKADLVFPSVDRRDSRGNVLFNAAEDMENRRRSDVEIERVDLGQYVDQVSSVECASTDFPDPSQCITQASFGDCHAALPTHGVSSPFGR